ncbi:hypothetical protein MPTK1_2g03320 [Marchantia polymorpha subsp. ruderalis]|uniref:Uncharacterized protein n=1 Tax=Marchantia polymorpha TaxID=3197 RepID=A0A2R6W071_MARPO|nr:hypothetical protein MARPO_0211s0015 [Marchantia polymorpha]BBN00949.1 hypothetical protein Mp_2g03320 [Marchantia polymorpha subsp. ruderalis]|eukprot:PTQ27255.1 hypothetical protein MARPO_0211s0015 [Marchantia polymorpha]
MSLCGLSLMLEKSTITTWTGREGKGARAVRRDLTPGFPSLEVQLHFRTTSEKMLLTFQIRGLLYSCTPLSAFDRDGERERERVVVLLLPSYSAVQTPQHRRELRPSRPPSSSSSTTFVLSNISSAASIVVVGWRAREYLPACPVLSSVASNDCTFLTFAALNAPPLLPPFSLPSPIFAPSPHPSPPHTLSLSPSLVPGPGLPRTRLPYEARRATQRLKPQTPRCRSTTGQSAGVPVGRSSEERTETYGGGSYGGRREGTGRDLVV